MGGVDLPSPSLPPVPSLRADSSYSSWHPSLAPSCISCTPALFSTQDVGVHSF